MLEFTENKEYSHGRRRRRRRLRLGVVASIHQVFREEQEWSDVKEEVLKNGFDSTAAAPFRIHEQRKNGRAGCPVASLSLPHSPRLSPFATSLSSLSLLSPPEFLFPPF